MIHVYHLEHIDNGTRITAYPDTHAHCLTIRSKQQTPANWKLVEAGRTGSFIVRSRITGNAIDEIWNESTRDAVDNSRFEVVPIMQYLQELNSK